MSGLCSRKNLEIILERLHSAGFYATAPRELDGWRSGSSKHWTDQMGARAFSLELVPACKSTRPPLLRIQQASQKLDDMALCAILIQQIHCTLSGPAKGNILKSRVKGKLVLVSLHELCLPFKTGSRPDQETHAEEERFSRS